MPRIKGPSGVVVDAPEHVASGLVNAGYAEYVKDKTKDEPKEAKTNKPKK